MHGFSLNSSDDGRREYNARVGLFDAPAFARRAKQLESALDHVHRCCQIQREEWLVMPRIRLGHVVALSGVPEYLTPYLLNGVEVDVVRELVEALKPQLRAPVTPTTNPRRLRRAVNDLAATLVRFNGRSLPYLHQVDITEINKRITDYHRYYLLEKECVVHSYRLARHGFPSVGHVDFSWLCDRLPPLPMPRLKS